MKSWNIHTSIQHRWSRKVSFFCLWHDREFLFWCTCVHINRYINLKKGAMKHVDMLSGMFTLDYGMWFDSCFLFQFGRPFVWRYQLLQPFVRDLHFSVLSDKTSCFVWQNMRFCPTKSRLASVCMETQFFSVIFYFRLRNQPIFKFFKCENLKNGMCARKYGQLGHQTDKKRNDIIL